MKKLLITIAAVFFSYSAIAADITLYYSPTCPHCHHAMEFLKTELPDVKRNEINVSEPANRDKFIKALKECKLENGYIPLAVIGKKCFQGFGETTKAEYKTALGITDKQNSPTQKESLQQEPATINEASPTQQEQPGINETIQISYSSLFLYALLGVLVIALGFVLFRKKK
ncbi:hypothetical protein FACS18945_6090 [Bacteroidia bacterium]|nr:hypothetical protein FACS18945_6090 [Bacteroidia bacterium]